MIVIPMAGLSSRFTKAGYDKPKYMLPLHGKSIFWHAIMSFKKYFSTEFFLFIARDILDTKSFLEKEIKELGIKKYEVIFLEKETRGQAETVELGLKKASVSEEDSLTIFNIDSFRKDFSFPEEEWFKTSDGYLEVFEGTGENWSYVEAYPKSSVPAVKRTVEKEIISNLCSNGLYHFSSGKDFLYSVGCERARSSGEEIYIAPLYNYLIKKGKKINYHLIQERETVFCGVPDEYNRLK